MNNMSGKRGT